MKPARAIGSYDVLGELGRGGMGTVLRVQHRATGALRALKLLDLPPDAEAVERFRREAAALALAGGEGVVPIHESGVENGRFYYVMGFMGAGSLRDRLRRGPLPWREACHVVARLARTLDRCHVRGLVHRDVKPENVLFDEAGEPCVADFGCVRDTTARQLTMTGIMIGTVTYMAPEQLEGHHVDARADVFSLGVVLHETVAGSLPFTGRTPLDQLMAIRDTRPRSVSADSEAPPGLDAILARALAPDPATRYERAAELAQDLERLLAGEAPIRAARSSSLCLVLGLAALAVAFLGGAILWKTTRGRPAPLAPLGPAEQAGTDVAEALALIDAAPLTTKAWLLARDKLLFPELSKLRAAALDAAVAAAPTSPRPRELRATVLARSGLPVPASDLEAVLALDASRADELAAVALPVGVSGPRALPVLRALHERVPRAERLALLLAVECLATGGLEERAEATHVLASIGPTLATASRLRSSLDGIDGFARSLLALDEVGWRQEIDLNGSTFAARMALPPLKAEHLERATPGVLAPLTPAARAVVRWFPYHDGAHAAHRLRPALVSVLDRVPEALTTAPLAAARTLVDTADEATELDLPTVELAAARCESLLASDPYLWATVLFFALERRVHSNNRKEWGEAYDDIACGRFVDASAMRGELVVAAAMARPGTTDSERAWGESVRFHLIRISAVACETAHHGPGRRHDPVDWDERALARRQVAANMSLTEDAFKDILDGELDLLRKALSRARDGASEEVVRSLKDDYFQGRSGVSLKVADALLGRVGLDPGQRRNALALRTLSLVAEHRLPEARAALHDLEATPPGPHAPIVAILSPDSLARAIEDAAR